MSPYLTRPLRTEAQAIADILASPQAKLFRRLQVKQNKTFRQARMEARNLANTPWDKPA